MENLSDKSKKDLEAIAKKLDIKGYSKLTKSELVDKITAKQTEEPKKASKETSVKEENKNEVKVEEKPQTEEKAESKKEVAVVKVEIPEHGNKPVVVKEEAKSVKRFDIVDSEGYNYNEKFNYSEM